MERRKSSFEYGTRLYVLEDANWNITAVVDVSGTVQERYVYNPYGAATFLAPDWSARSGSSVNWIYLHQDGRFDIASGLYNFRNRDYSPTLGRWLQQDPLGYLGAMSSYDYLQASPAANLDPSGLYDQAGHFYTTYMVAIAAGKTPDEAYQLAYYSQLPDQVTEFQAIPAAPTLLLNPVPNQRAWAHQIEELQHSLAGGNAGPRRACLKKLIEQGDDQGELTPWQKGLAIHALGDAYAHTKLGNSEELYSAPLGHLFDWHKPDIIGYRPDLYKDYVESLYAALGGNPNDETTLKLIIDKGYTFNGNHDADWQIQEMRNLASEQFGYDGPYFPEEGGIVENMTLSREQVQDLLNRIAKACECNGNGSR